MKIYTENDFLELNKAVLKNGNILRFRIKGKSMQPFLRDKEIVLIESFQPEELKAGDIIFYRVPPSQIVIHRLIQRDKSSGKILFITKGDASFYFDPYVNPEDILGKIIAVERDGKEIKLDTRIAKLKAYFYVRCFLIRRRVWLIPAKLKKQVGLVLRRLQGTKIYGYLIQKISRGKVTYRVATDEDAVFLARLFKVYSPYYAKQEALERYFKKYIEDLKGVGSCFLAEYNNKIVGSVTVKQFPDDETVYSGWRIYNRVVHWRYRRIGIGEKLTRIALKEAIERGADSVKCILLKSDIRSINLCKKLGTYQIQGGQAEEILFGLNREQIEKIVC